jgi:hypothetical protein
LSLMMDLTRKSLGRSSDFEVWETFESIGQKLEQNSWNSSFLEPLKTPKLQWIDHQQYHIKSTLKIQKSPIKITTLNREKY